MPVPQPQTGGIALFPLDKAAPVEGARIVFGGGESPTANLVVAARLPNDYHAIHQCAILDVRLPVYPWPSALVRYGPKNEDAEWSDG